MVYFLCKFKFTDFSKRKIFKLSVTIKLEVTTIILLYGFMEFIYILPLFIAPPVEVNLWI